MNISLALCPAWSREMPHLAIALLSAFLRREGHNVHVFDFNNEFYHNTYEYYKDKWNKAHEGYWKDINFTADFISANEKLIDLAVLKILSAKPSIIGFSVYQCNEIMSLELARRIKKIDKSKIIIFGGPQCLIGHKGEAIIEEDAVDIVVSGEGEETLLELIRLIETNGKIDFCEGALLKIDGQIVNCGNRLPIEDLDEMPYADFTDFKFSDYEFPNSLPVLSSRGCIQKCVYCSVNAYWGGYRSFSGERLFKEVEYQLKIFKDVRDFRFYDPTINGNIEALEKFCDLIIARKEENDFPSIGWQGEAVIRREMTSMLLKKMKDSGCYHLAYGIESGSQKVLKDMKKYLINIKDAELIIRETSELGISVALNFMFGFPTENAEDFKDTLEFIRRNHIYIDAVIPSESFCTIIKKTYLHRHPEEFGLTGDPDPDFWESFDGSNNYLERLNRFEQFCQLALSLNIACGSGYDKLKNHRQSWIQRYHHYLIIGR